MPHKVHLNPFASRLVSLTAISMFIALGSHLIASWRGKLLTEELVFRVEDAWCDSAVQGIGLHCFSDFGLPRTGGVRLETYIGFNASNTPFANLLFHPFALFDYNVGLLIYLALLSACWFVPIYLSAKPLSRLERFAVACLISAGSVGFISVIDRGNHIAFIVPALTYYYLNFADERKFAGVAISLFLVISLKFWGLLLIPHVLLSRKFRLATFATVGASVVNLGVLAITPGGFFKNLSRVLDVTTDGSLAAGIAPYTLSLTTLLLRAECTFDVTEHCQSGLTTGSFFGSSSVRVIFGIFFILLSIKLWRKYSDDLLTQSGIFLGISILAVPEAGIYTLVLAGSVIALGLRTYSFNTSELARAHYWLIICLVVSTTPISFKAFSALPISMSVGLRYHYFVTPCCWIAFFSYLICTRGPTTNQFNRTVSHEQNLRSA